MSLDRNERVAVAKVLIVLGSDALLFLADETPNFISFYVAHLNVDESSSP